MKYLTLLLFVSCANTGYKMHDNTRIKYTIREYYLPVKSVEPVKTVKTVKTVPSKPKPKKAVKKAKKAKKVDCGLVLREINQCVK